MTKTEPEIPENDDVINRCGDPCPEAPDLDSCLLPRGHAYPWHRNRSSSWPLNSPDDFRNAGEAIRFIEKATLDAIHAHRYGGRGKDTA